MAELEKESGLRFKTTMSGVKRDHSKPDKSVNSRFRGDLGSFTCETGGYRSTDKRAPLRPMHLEEYLYTRSPRIIRNIVAENIEIEHPPSAGSEPEFNWVSILLTPMISVALIILMTVFMGINPIMLVMTGVMSVISAITAIITYRKQKAKFFSKEETISQKYSEYLSEIFEQLNEAHRNEIKQLEQSNPSPEKCVDILDKRSRTLWERTPADDDFLSARVGLGDGIPAVTASYTRPRVVLEENSLEEKAIEVANGSCQLTNIPILCSLQSGNQIGIIGNRTYEIQLVRNMIVELATTHSYDELKIVAIVPNGELEQWDWLRWLPHCTNEEDGARFVYASEEDAERGLKDFDDILKGRRADAGNDVDSKKKRCPYYLFIILERGVIENCPIRKQLQDLESIDCGAIYIYDNISVLPKECKQIIEVNIGRGTLYSRENVDVKTKFRLDSVELSTVQSFARKMAPLSLGKTLSAANLPATVTFLEGYHVQMPEELNIQRRWENTKNYRSMSVPIAVTEGGNIFDFDIKAGRHGPHGIVAGQTGFGKTEMVQSWLLSLAVNFSPQQVSFILIDFKGTGLIAPFEKLPHLAGSISDLDSVIDRNLTALKSELSRRETIIAKYKGQSILNINELNSSYDKGLVKERLAILLIVIDEFAQFRVKYPEFGQEIDALVSKGRSLGMFVILMTQTPAGIVSKVSEDNIAFRWCLATANHQASREMLGTSDAARIKNPGRAYIKVGEDGVYELVQSFWSGARYDPWREESLASNGVISLVGLDGSRKKLEHIGEKEAKEPAQKEIDAVVNYICQYCAEHDIPPAEKIWTESLPKRLSLRELRSLGQRAEAPIIALLDDPSTQRQYPLQLDLSTLGHTIVFGAPSTGKTTLLETYVCSVAMTYTPKRMNLYLVDFGGGALAMLSRFPHVGDIVLGNDKEQLIKLLSFLSDILSERMTRFTMAGVGNISAYRHTSDEILPDIVLVIDNLTVGLTRYPELSDILAELTVSGANYGIYLLASSTSTNITTKITSNIKCYFALQLNEKSEYSSIVGRVENGLPPITGRGFAKGAPPFEFQTALPVDGKNDMEISEGIQRFAEELDKAWSGFRPAPIPRMPEVIPYGSVATKRICIGLSCDKVQPVCYDSDKQHYLLISGTEESGKSYLLVAMAQQLKEKQGCTVYGFDINAQNRKLWKFADSCFCDGADVDSFIESLRPEMQRRDQALKEDTAESFAPIVLAIDDFTDFFAAVSNDTVRRLHALVKLGAGMKIFLLAAGDAYKLASHVNKGEPVVTALAKGKQLVLLGGRMSEHYIVQPKVPSEVKNALVNDYEGYVFRTKEYVKIKAMKGSDSL